MPKKFTVVIEQGEDGYLISDVVELPGCHTQGKTIDELLKPGLTVKDEKPSYENKQLQTEKEKVIIKDIKNGEIR